MREAADNFRVAILAALGHAPELIEPGRIHRFSTSARASDKAGWCQLFEDGRAGVFGDFRSGMSSVWTAQRRELMTPAERADMARRLAQAKAQREAQQRHEAHDAPGPRRHGSPRGSRSRRRVTSVRWSFGWRWRSISSTSTVARIEAKPSARERSVAMGYLADTGCWTEEPAIDTTDRSPVGTTWSRRP